MSTRGRASLGISGAHGWGGCTCHSSGGPATNTKAQPSQLLVGLAQRMTSTSLFKGVTCHLQTRRRRQTEVPRPQPCVSSDLLTCTTAVLSGALVVTSGATLTLGNLETVCGVTHQLRTPASPGIRVGAGMASPTPGPGL